MQRNLQHLRMENKSVENTREIWFNNLFLLFIQFMLKHGVSLQDLKHLILSVTCAASFFNTWYCLLQALHWFHHYNL